MDSNWLDHLDWSNEHQLDYSQRLFAKTLIFLAKTKLPHEPVHYQERAISPHLKHSES